MGAGGLLDWYTGDYADDAAVNTEFTNRGWTRQRGHLYYSNNDSELRIWDGSSWLAAGSTPGGGPWTRNGAGFVYPTTSTDAVVAGGAALAGSEKLRVVGDAVVDDRVAINAAAPLANTGLYIFDDIEDTTSRGGFAFLDKDASSTKALWRAWQSETELADGTVTDLRHFDALTFLDGGGTVTTAVGFQVQHDPEQAATDAIGTAEGLLVKSPAGSGSITTIRGVHIEDQNVNAGTGATRYGIYQAGADDVNYFAGQIGLNTVSPGTVPYMLVLDDDDGAAREGIRIFLDKDTSSTKSSWAGISSRVVLDDGSDAGAVTTAKCFEGRVLTNNGDITDCYGYHLLAPTVGSGDTITNLYGFRLEGPPSGGTVTSFYGLYVDGLNSGAVTNAYAIYQAGASDVNYFAGQIGQNISSPASTAHIQAVHDDASNNGEAYRANLAVTSASNINYEAFRSVIAVTSGTVTEASHFEAVTTVDGTLTTLYGLLVASPAVSGTLTTMYGLRVNDLSAAGTSYGIYQAGSGDTNYLAGDTGVGTSSPSSKLDVVGDCEVGSGDAFYLGDPTTDGTWRITRSGNNLVFQRRESGSYVTKDTITP